MRLCAACAVLLLGIQLVVAPLPGGNNVVAISPNGAVSEFVAVGSGGLHGPETSAAFRGSLYVMSTYTARILRYSLSDGVRFVCFVVLIVRAGQYQGVFVDGQAAGLFWRWPVLFIQRLPARLQFDSIQRAALRSGWQVCWCVHCVRQRRSSATPIDLRRPWTRWQTVGGFIQQQQSSAL